MTNRFLGFYFIAMLVVLTAAFLQRIYFSQDKPVDSSPLVAVDSSTDEIIDSSAVALTEQTEHNSPELIQNQEDSDLTNASSDENRDSTGTDKDQVLQDNEERETQEITVAGQPPKLYTIGSLAADSHSRFLVTIDASGGAIRRIELNCRDEKGDHRYRDLEYTAGYLGEIDCYDTKAGCVVGVVGEGTPAKSANIEAGDLIKSVNGEPILSAQDFNELLLNTRPGDQLMIVIQRGTGQTELTCQIELTEKPIELVRPQPDILGIGWSSLPSFRSTIRRPQENNPVWPELDSLMMDGEWKLDSLDENEITLSFVIRVENKETEQANDAFRVTKTYRIPDSGALDSAAENGDSFHRNFHIDLDLSIENLSSEQADIAYQLDGPLGAPTETWWYQNKIHGRSSAIMYTAGARDVVASTGQSDFTFFGCPEIVTNLKSTDPDYFWLLSPPNQTDASAQSVRFLSVDAQYFNVALLPKNSSEQNFTAYSVLADAATTNIPKNAKEQKLVDCTFRLFKKVDLAAGEKYSQTFEIFAGPKEPELLGIYGLDEVRSFGWFALFSKPLCWLLKFFHWATFGFGYGIPIILLTILVRSIMIPISRKAAINAQMMQFLQPQMKEIADKYKNDMEKRGQAQRDLFRKYNYNPFSGCFMMFFQLPIFIGLYRGLSVDIALRDQPLFPGLGWCTNLAAPDQLWHWKESLPSFMSFLTSETGFLGPYFNLLPIVTCVLFVVQQKMFTPPPTDEQQELMQSMMKYMMVFMGFLFFKVPAGLCLYFITSAVWSIAERKMLPKPQLDTSKLEKLDGSSGGNEVKSDKATAKAEIEKQKRVEAQDEKRRRDRDRKKRLKRRDRDD